MCTFESCACRVWCAVCCAVCACVVCCVCELCVRAAEGNASGIRRMYYKKLASIHLH